MIRLPTMLSIIFLELANKQTNEKKRKRIRSVECARQKERTCSHISNQNVFVTHTIPNAIQNCTEKRKKINSRARVFHSVCDLVPMKKCLVLGNIAILHQFHLIHKCLDSFFILSSCSFDDFTCTRDHCEAFACIITK